MNHACEYCGDVFVNAGAASSHSKHCKHNPENFKPCKVCGSAVESKDREYCSHTCANKDRSHSADVKNRISDAVKGKSKRNGNYLTCDNCDKTFYRIPSESDSRFCSLECRNTWYKENPSVFRDAGLKSAANQSKRSKNEKYFAKLCKQHFDRVLTNEPIFDGWDADVILPDYNLAILWNGKWHYEKITEQHSLDQVQTRDKIKKSAIEDHGFKPYVIKDMGSFDPNFVEQEYRKFVAQYAG